MHEDLGSIPSIGKRLGMVAHTRNSKTGGSAVPGHPQLHQFESRRLYISNDPKLLLHDSPGTL